MGSSIIPCGRIAAIQKGALLPEKKFYQYAKNSPVDGYKKKE